MTRVLLFAKAPRLGFVKTRLARDMGAERALDIYRMIGRNVAASVAKEYPLTVWYDPSDAEPEMRRWLGDFEFRSQVGEDLGERMAFAFREHFGRGESPVMAIGADAPGVSAVTISEAATILGHADVVLGPAFDGGYYLLGSHALHERLFHGIPWGTRIVRQVTEQRCRDLDLTVGHLAVQRDVDTEEDVQALGMRHT